MGADFYADYLGGSESLRPFFAHGVSELGAAAELPPWDEGMRGAMLKYQTQMGLEREIAAESFAVVTGQQPGLLTGPLYTIFKAITAIKLARRASAELGRAVVPIFWVAADDHDFEEVRVAQVLTQDHSALELRYAPTANVEGLAMHRVPLEASLHALVDRAANETPGGEFREEVRAFLHESLDASRSFSDWFARILARLFRDSPLLIFTTELPVARDAARAIFEREIRTPLESTRLVNEAGKRLAALGHTPQVVKADDECAFFLEVESRRRKVLYRDGAFYVPEEKLTFGEAELLAVLAEAPGRFSANVALRPVVQQCLFPTLAYVGGPGEIAYWAQFKDVFAHFGQPMPVVYPRAQGVLTTIKLNKLLAKYGLTPGELMGPKDALLQRALESSVKSPALDMLRRERGDVVHATEKLRAAMLAVSKLPKPAADATEAAAEQINTALERLEKSLLRADAAQTETVHKQIERLCSALAPDRKPQERVFTIFSFLFEHGWGLVDRLTDALDTDGFALNEIEL